MLLCPGGLVSHDHEGFTTAESSKPFVIMTEAHFRAELPPPSARSGMNAVPTSSALLPLVPE